MMKLYSIEFMVVRPRSQKLVVSMDFKREHFTIREFKEFLIGQLFELAGKGVKYKWLTAIVKRDGVKFLTVRCDTVVDGSAITAHMYAARPRERYRHIRSMVIGQ